ncbi:MAG: hypothetical protein Q8T11_13715 [Elusimicrobiota bacterium]|nr:hypothetical protein [Elusimicrobiota bacterium]
MRKSALRTILIGTISMTLIGCTRVPAQVKKASADQSAMLAAFEQSITAQDLAKGCSDSFKAAVEMEAALKKQGETVQARINKNFTDSKIRATKIQAASAEMGATKEAKAMQILIEETTQLQSSIVAIRADIEAEKAKCTVAMGFVRDMVHSMSAAQAELDKFIQSDARSPVEAFVYSLVETKALSARIDRAANQFQSKMSGLSDKIGQLEAFSSQVKE